MNIDDYVINTQIGLSKIIDSYKKDSKNYYILQSKDNINLEIEENDINTRKLLTKNEASSILDNIKTLSDEWIKKPHERYAKYRSLVENRNIKDLIIVIKRLYIEDKYSYGKGLNSEANDIYLKAKKYLFEELSLIYEINEDEVDNFIQHRTGESNNGI